MVNYGEFIWDFAIALVPTIVVLTMLWLILDWCRSILFK